MTNSVCLQVYEVNRDQLETQTKLIRSETKTNLRFIPSGVKLKHTIVKILIKRIKETENSLN